MRKNKIAEESKKWGIFGSIFLHPKARKLLQNSVNSVLEKFEISPSVMWGNLKYPNMPDVEKCNISPHLSCKDI